MVFTTANNILEADNVILKNGQTIDYFFTSPNIITLKTAPQATDSLTCSYWTTASLINSGKPYEIPSKLEDLLFKVRSLIGEQYTEEWGDRMITDWFNEAINVICTKADFPFMEAESSIMTVIGQEAYQLPAGFKKMIKMYYKATSCNDITQGQPYRDSREDLETSTLVRSYYAYNGYTLFNETIIIPNPTDVREFKVRYYRYLPYFDSTDTATRSKIPRQYEDMLIDYAINRAKQQEEIYDVAKLHQEMFARRFDDMVVDLTRRVDEEWPSIRAASNMY